MFSRIFRIIISAITALVMTASITAYPIKAYGDFFIIIDGETYYFDYSDSEEQLSDELSVNVSSRTDTSITLSWNKINNAETYKLYYYNTKKKKYSLYKKLSADSIYSSTVRQKVTDLKSDKKYKFFIKAYNKKGKLLDSIGISASTYPAAPALNIAVKDKYIKLSWTSKQDDAVGYELYKKEDDYMINSAPTLSYSSLSASELKSYDFTLAARSSSKAAKSLKLKKSASYVYIVRTFTIENGKKKYSAFSEAYHTQSPAAYVNSLKLNPEKIVYGEEYDLVKKYVNSVIDKDMTNIQKLSAIFNLVHSHGTYQYDINKIDGNRPVWQIMVKGEGQCASWAFCLDAMLEYAGFDTRVVRGTRPSGQHFWCQLKLNGKWYDLDAQLGDFLMEYTDCSSHNYVVQEAF